MARVGQIRFICCIIQYDRMYAVHTVISNRDYSGLGLPHTDLANSSHTLAHTLQCAAVMRATRFSPLPRWICYKGGRGGTRKTKGAGRW